jgi:hypothetical protein
MKESGDEFFEKLLRKKLAARKSKSPRRIPARAIREATMDKVDELFFSSDRPMYPSAAIGTIYSDSYLHLKDRRIARLIVLMRQLHESHGGLGALPKPELHEIVSCAVRLCDFVNPIEARDVIAAVLEALETPNPLRESP